MVSRRRREGTTVREGLSRKTKGAEPSYGWSDYSSHTLAEWILRIRIQFSFGHVRTYSWLHKLRNTQGKIYGTYLGKIYGIYEENMKNIQKYLWYKIIRNTDPMGRPPHWGAAEGGACFSDYFISYLFIDMPYIFLIYSIHIPYRFPSYVPYIFPCVFLNLWSQE